MNMLLLLFLQFYQTLKRIYIYNRCFMRFCVWFNWCYIHKGLRELFLGGKISIVLLRIVRDLSGTLLHHHRTKKKVRNIYNKFRPLNFLKKLTTPICSIRATSSHHCPHEQQNTIWQISYHYYHLCSCAAVYDLNSQYN